MSDELHFKNIVCATDLSDASNAAVRLAIKMAKGSLPTRLHVLHVSSVDQGSKDTVGAGTELQMRVADLHRAWEYEMVGVRKRLAQTPEVEVVSSVRIGSNAAEEIACYLMDTKADLLVVGTHGRTGLKRAVLGSVAEQLVRTASCPVLVVRA